MGIIVSSPIDPAMLYTVFLTVTTGTKLPRATLIQLDDDNGDYIDSTFITTGRIFTLALY